MKKTNFIMKTFAVASAVLLGVSSMMTPVKVSAAPYQIITEDKNEINLNFTKEGVNSPYFYVKNWTLTNNKGCIDYIDSVGPLTTALVMENNTDINFTTMGSYTMYLYFSFDSNGKTVNVDGRNEKIEHNCVMTHVDAGTHDITMGNGETALFLVSLFR